MVLQVRFGLPRVVRDRLIGSAFGPLLKPNVCVLLDVGTKPTGTSIYEVSFSFADPAKKLTGSYTSALRNTRMSEELAERFLLIPVRPLPLLLLRVIQCSGIREWKLMNRNIRKVSVQSYSRSSEFRIQG